MCWISSAQWHFLMITRTWSLTLCPGPGYCAEWSPLRGKRHPVRYPHSSKTVWPFSSVVFCIYLGHIPVSSVRWTCCSLNQLRSRVSFFILVRRSVLNPPSKTAGDKTLSPSSDHNSTGQPNYRPEWVHMRWVRPKVGANCGAKGKKNCN